MQRSVNVTVTATPQNGQAQPFQQTSGAMPASCSFTTATATTVWMMWAEVSPGNSPVVPSAQEVIDKGFPVRLGSLVTSTWDPNDQEQGDPSQLYLAVEQGTGDLRMFS